MNSTRSLITWYTCGILLAYVVNTSSSTYRAPSPLNLKLAYFNSRQTRASCTLGFCFCFVLLRFCCCCCFLLFVFGFCFCVFFFCLVSVCFFVCFCFVCLFVSPKEFSRNHFLVKSEPFLAFILVSENLCNTVVYGAVPMHIIIMILHNL